MSARKRLTVLIGPAGSVWAEVAGWRARDLLLEVGGRPVWSPRRKVWSTTPQRASDAMCLAEERGYEVTVTEAGETA